jgi:hypothetical protein
VGGTIGALVAGKGKPGYAASQAMYWKSFLWTVVLTTIVVFSISKGTTHEAMFLLGGLLLLAGPLFLLGASLIMSFWISVRKAEPPQGKTVFDPEFVDDVWNSVRKQVPSRVDYWGHLGRITLGVIIGSVLGFLLMYVPFLMASRR